MLVTVDSEDVARKVCRRAQNGGRERKMKGVIENSYNNIFKKNFPQKNTNCIFF
jgi:hypothetical protein